MTATATRPRKTTTKGRKKFTPKTPEQRAAETEARQKMLMDQVATLTSTEGWKAYLKFSTHFHSYSFGNLMLIMSQKPDATRCAGYKTWEKLGRKPHPKTGLKIVAPRTRWPRQDEIDAGKDPNKKIVYFVGSTVFDISDTYVIDEERWAKVGGDYVEGGPQLLEGDDEQGMGDKLAAYLTTLGWTVEERDLPGSKQGHADPKKKEVVFQLGTDPAERASTLAHEAAHVVDGHTDDMAEYAQHRGRMEAIAESVAYVIAARFGIDTSPYSIHYVAGWTKGDLDLLKEIAEAVHRTVKTILAAIAPEEQPEDEDDDPMAVRLRVPAE